MTPSHTLVLVLSSALALSLGACDKPEPAYGSATPMRTAPAPSTATNATTTQSSQPPTQSAPSAAAPTEPSSQPAERPTLQEPAVAEIPSAFDSHGQRRTCAQMTPRAGYDCVETPNGPAQVLSHTASADVDPCATATCLPGTRCQSQSVELGGSMRRLPRCVPTGPMENVLPSRDPCVSYLCPLGYRCKAPADRPACVPESAGW